MPVPLTQWFHHGRDCFLSLKSMLKNFSAFLQLRIELHSSVFEEIHEHRFIQQILYGTHYYLDIHQYSQTKHYWKTFPYHLCLYEAKLVKEKLMLLNMHRF